MSPLRPPPRLHFRSLTDPGEARRKSTHPIYQSHRQESGHFENSPRPAPRPPSRSFPSFPQAAHQPQSTLSSPASQTRHYSLKLASTARRVSDFLLTPPGSSPFPQSQTRTRHANEAARVIKASCDAGRIIKQRERLALELLTRELEERAPGRFWLGEGMGQLQGRRGRVGRSGSVAVDGAGVDRKVLELGQTGDKDPFPGIYMRLCRGGKVSGPLPPGLGRWRDVGVWEDDEEDGGGSGGEERGEGSIVAAGLKRTKSSAVGRMKKGWVALAGSCRGSLASVKGLRVKGTRSAGEAVGGNRKTRGGSFWELFNRRGGQAGEKGNTAAETGVSGAVGQVNSRAHGDLGAGVRRSAELIQLQLPILNFSTPGLEETVNAALKSVNGGAEGENLEARSTSATLDGQTLQENKDSEQKTEEEQEQHESMVLDAESWYDDMHGTDSRAKGKGVDRGPVLQPSSSEAEVNPERPSVPNQSPVSYPSSCNPDDHSGYSEGSDLPSQPADGLPGGSNSDS
ncbi:hypothetical protein VTI74DRAFT_7146 [Chaetomium olivicolor]